MRAPTRSRASGVIAGACVLAIAASITGRAGAQTADPGAAQALFDAGMALMKEEKYADACPKLEESFRLDPGVGTQFRLAECYEKIGRVARAWALFLDVAEATKRDRNPKREKQARDRAEAIKARVPKLTLHVARVALDLPGFELFKDGAPISKTQIDLAVPTDPGEHVILAKAPGKQAWERKLTLAEGASIEVSVPALEEEAPPAPKAPPPRDARAPSEGPGGAVIGMRVGAGVAAAAGLAGIVVGSVMGARASAQWKEALTYCGGVPDHCGEKGRDLGGRASTSATISTAGFVAGGVLVAGSAVLLGLSFRDRSPVKQPAFLVVPSIAPGSATASLIGRF